MKNIILVDDDPTTIYISELLISSISKNIQIKSFTNPLDLISTIEDLQISEKTLLIIDLNMPQMNGWDFLRHIETLGLKCQIVVLTSSSNIIEIEKVKKFKFVKKVFSKPIQKEDISEFIS